MRAAAIGRLATIVSLLTPLATFAQTYDLNESTREGQISRLSVHTDLSGTLKVSRDGKPVAIPIKAKNEHVFAERILSARRGLPRKVARFYSTAVSRATIDGNSVDRSLAEDRRLIVAQRTGDALMCYSPVGPLSRSEVQVVSEHFETIHLIGVLPGKPIVVGDRWKLENTIAQSLCLFEGLISHDLTAHLKEVSSGIASIGIEGNAKGIEHGALANLTVTASVRFDVNAKRIIAVEWKQKDVREQGPISPAAEIETTTIVKRDALPAEPAELSAAAMATIPPDDEPTMVLKQLVHREAKGRYQFLCSRDWHIVGQTDHHLVMRLLERGDFVAQVTLAPWQNAKPGQHLAPDEFERLVAAGTGWKVEQVLDRQEVPTDSGRWIYRIVARGTLEGNAVVQNFYVVTTAGGEQMIVTFTMKPATASRLGTRDLELVNAIVFPAK